MKIAIYIVLGLMALLALYAVYLIVRYPKDVFYGFLRYLKDGPIFPGNLLLIVIWGPVWIVDRVFKLGIYSEHEL